MATDPEQESQIIVADILPLQNVEIDVPLGSRKKLLQHLAELTARDTDALDAENVFKILTEREKLGSTGVGHGIALPHGRIDSLQSPVLAVIRLREAIDFDAPDSLPVWLAVCLLVPADATHVHLKLLARLAGKFGQEDFLRGLREAESPADMYKQFLNV